MLIEVVSCQSCGSRGKPRATPPIRAFTLIEIITVAVILAVLSMVAVPAYLEYRENAEEAAEQAVVGGVKSAIRSAGVRSALAGAVTWPAALDAAAANSPAAPNNPLFSQVLSTPITGDWSKGKSVNAYVSPRGTEYVYTPADGSFRVASATAVGPSDGTDDPPPPPTPPGPPGSPGLTQAQVQALAAGDIADAGLTPEQIAWLTPEQLAGLSAEELAALTDEQLQALTSEQVAALSYDQFESVVGRLSASQIGDASPEQIAMLASDTFNSLSPAQRAAFTEAQLAERAVADGVRALTLYGFRTLTPENAKYLTAAQIATIPSSYEMSRIPAEVRAVFSARQVQGLDTARVSIGYLTAEQREDLTTAQIQGLGTFYDLRYLPASRIAEVTTSLIAAIPSSYEMGRIPQASRAAFTAEQLQAINTTKVSIGYLTSEQREQLTTAQIQGLATSYEIRYVPATRIGEVTTTLIAKLPSSYEMSRIPDDVRAAFTTEQVQALNTANVSIGYLTAGQREQLSTAQIQGLGTNYDIRYLPASRVGEVTPALIATLPNSYEMSRIPDDVRAAFTTEQVQAVNTANVSIGYLTTTQREQLSATQLQGMGTYYDIRYVPASRVAEVTPALVATLPNSYEMSRIPDDVRAAFTTEQVQAVNTANVSIGYLTTPQREQLTGAQLQGLGTYYDLRYVPASRAAEVTPALVAALPNSYEMSRIPTDVRASFTAAQVQAVNTAAVSISYLTDGQRSQLTTGQIQSLGTSNDLRYVTPSRINEVTPALVGAIASSYSFNQITTDRVQSFTREQVLVIPVSYYDQVKSRLTPEQLAWRP